MSERPARSDESYSYSQKLEKVVRDPILLVSTFLILIPFILFMI